MRVIRTIKRVMYITLFIISVSNKVYSQGYNHNFLIGYTSGIDTNVISKRGVLQFDSSTVTVIPTNFKMPFLIGNGNISDSNGNLLMVSNGCWIADATLDTMQNGGGLNPNQFTSDWCTNITGIPYPHSNIILPWPGDSSKYVLFHQTGSYDVPNGKSLALYYTVIDLTLNGGLGGVINSQKNLIAIQDTLNPMLAACKHANGRDWWIIAFEDNTDVIYKILFTPTGISSVTTQAMNVSPNFFGMGQANFSPDGKKFAYHHRDFNLPSGIPVYHTIRLFDFDRCTGMLSNKTIISLTDSVSGNGMAFSSNSKLLYFTLFNKIYQINTDTTNIQASLRLVATNDNYCFPYSFTCADFWLMYLAANGKMYISSGNSVIDMHYINYPDSAGIACDVQQHALHLPSWYVRGNVYHPNYYLGCDTTQTTCPCLTGVNEISQHDFKFSVSPNPTDGGIKIIYLLPQNQSGTFEVYDITGKMVFSYSLPQWSTLQNFDLRFLSNGVYNCMIRSGNYIVAKKLAIIRD